MTSEPSVPSTLTRRRPGWDFFRANVAFATTSVGQYMTFVLLQRTGRGCLAAAALHRGFRRPGGSVIKTYPWYPPGKPEAISFSNNVPVTAPAYPPAGRTFATVG